MSRTTIQLSYHIQNFQVQLQLVSIDYHHFHALKYLQVYNIQFDTHQHILWHCTQFDVEFLFRSISNDGVLYRTNWFQFDIRVHWSDIFNEFYWSSLQRMINNRVAIWIEYSPFLLLSLKPPSDALLDAMIGWPTWTIIGYFGNCMRIFKSYWIYKRRSLLFRA